jgi:hypothetical protein
MGIEVGRFMELTRTEVTGNAKTVLVGLHTVNGGPCMPTHICRRFSRVMSVRNKTKLSDSPCLSKLTTLASCCGVHCGSWHSLTQERTLSTPYCRRLKSRRSIAYARKAACIGFLFVGFAVQLA